MRVKEIHFNHDTSSATSDALNLRQNGTAIITAPEWVAGISHPAAYARRQIVRNVTIKVRFGDGPPNRSATIRAVDGGKFSSNVLNYLFGTGNVLGEVREKTVNFDAAGESGLETFQITASLRRALTSVTEIAWIWQGGDGSGKWRDFDTTRHRIYVIPDLPTPPWTQDLAEPGGLQLPWADALEHACIWAFGTGHVHAAAEAITREVNSRPQHKYFRDTQFAPGGTEFELQAYLLSLSTLPDVSMNCRDTSSLLVTFANLLGASLSPMVMQSALRLNNLPGFVRTKPVLLVGQNIPNQNNWVAKTWGWHEMVMSGMTDATGALIPGLNVVGMNFLGPVGASSMLVYDACLQLNSAAAHLAIAKPLGDMAQPDTYRHDLIQSVDGGVDVVTVQGMRPVT